MLSAEERKDNAQEELAMPQSKEELDALDPELRLKVKQELARKLKEAAHLLETSMQETYSSICETENIAENPLHEENASNTSVEPQPTSPQQLSATTIAKSDDASSPSTPNTTTTLASSCSPQELSVPDGSGYMYNWSQSVDQITILFVVPNTFQSKDISLSLTDTTVSCKLSSEKEPRVKGRLFSKINPFDSMWQIEDPDGQSDSTHKLLTLHLEKDEQIEWPRLFTCGIENDLDLDPQALFEAGTQLYSSGDNENAIKYVTMSAEKNCIAAQLKLAAWYELGQESSKDYPLPRDPSAAHYWHKKAAESGNGEACYIVANAYVHGTHGTIKDYQEAANWFKKCAESSFVAKKLPAVFISACFQLGLLYMEGGEGLGNPQPAEAARFWRLSAALGHPASIYNLGVFYLNGYGVEQDMGSALSMIALARKADPSLQLPPPLQDFTQQQLKSLEELVAKNPRDKRTDKKQYLTYMTMMAKKQQPKETKTDSREKRVRFASKPRAPSLTRDVLENPAALMGAGLIVAIASIGLYSWLRVKN